MLQVIRADDGHTPAIPHQPRAMRAAELINIVHRLGQQLKDVSHV